MIRKLIILPVLIILSLVLVPAALAQGPEGGQVVFGQNYTLAAEKTLNGDLVVFGGNVDTRPSSTVRGDVVVFGGNISIDGTVEGEIAVIGGNVNLGETARVEGNIIYIGGQVSIAEGAEVKGTVTNPLAPPPEGTFFASTPPPFPESPPEPPPPLSGFAAVLDRAISMVASLVWGVVMLVGLAAISGLAAAFLPEQVGAVGEAVARAPVLSFGVGLLTAVVSTVVGIVLLLTICLAFIPALAWMVLAVAMLLGWIAIGQIIGDRLLEVMGQPYPNLVVSTVLGVLTLTLAANMPVVSWIPCIGFLFGLAGKLFGLVAGLTGLGAALLTRFGTRPYAPQPAFTGPGRPPADFDDEDLGINPASEEELNSRIKSALDEESE